MKRKLLFLLGIFLLLIVIGGFIKLLSSRSPKEGELRVESTPIVGVFLDNKHLGRSPLKEKLKTGEYTLRLVPESATSELAPWQGKISVGANLLTYVNAVLSDSELSSAVDILWLEKSVAKKPELSVITNPDGATVVVDDTTRGVTPLTMQDIDVGEHSLTIASPGFLTRTMKIKLTTGFKLIANLKLALSTIGGQPEEASVSAEVSRTPTPTTKPGTTKSPTPTGATTTTSDPKKPYALILDTPTGFLRVRMEPSTAATEAGRVKPGEKYHISDEKSGWYEISYDGTNDGWISGQYADKVE
mgnify:CR=1 FL=1